MGHREMSPFCWVYNCDLDSAVLSVRREAAAEGRWVRGRETELVVARRDGKVENLLLVFHFPIPLRRGCGNVGISRFLADCPRSWGRRGRPVFGFPRLPRLHHFHGLSSPPSTSGIAAEMAIRSCTSAAVCSSPAPSASRTRCRSFPWRACPTARSPHSPSSTAPLRPAISVSRMV